MKSIDEKQAGSDSREAVPVAISNGAKEKSSEATLQRLIHFSPRMISQRQRIESLFGMNSHGDESTPVQKRENNTGMSDQLKSGIESLSGMDMSSVRVHRNSPKPAQLNAHAYTQGTSIHVAPGQDRHIPHEAWHVVQQMQGRVQPTISVGGQAVNDSPSLEREADVMGAKANR